MQLLDNALPELGLATRRAPIRVQDLDSFDGAFLANARGVAAVGRIDDDALVVPTERLNTILDAYASVPWDAI